MATAVDSNAHFAHHTHLPTPEVVTATLNKPKRLMSRTQLAQRIAQGEILLLSERTIYKLDNWINKHPGGQLAILHFVGRDASDEIAAYHSPETLRRMGAFAIATLREQDWLGEEATDGTRQGFRALVPPIHLGYRDGKLDSQDAHDDLWQRQKASSSKIKRGRLSPSPGSDSGYSDGHSSQLEPDGDLNRPESFPLPLELLEPPTDPEAMDAGRERAISADFKLLHQQVQDAGLYKLHSAGYARECTRYFALALTAYLIWHYAEARASYLLTSSFFLGLFWHQLTFTAHDAGHMGITGKHYIDRSIGILIANFIGGLSLGWWCDNHDVHHLVTNHPEHDPDIQHMPFFAVSPRFLVWQRKGGDNEEGEKAKTKVELGLWSSYYRRVLAFDAPARFLLGFQHKIYYFIMSLGRFNLYAESYAFLALKAKKNRWFWAESIGIVFFWCWFGVILSACPSWKVRVGYILISHVTTSPLHVQIVLSHFAQSSQDLGLTESFASRQVRTTMDVQCPPYLDFLHGGLHMQVSHHLFPRVPRHNLRTLRDLYVRPFCEKWDLKYEEYQFTEGNRKVLKVLKEVADQVKILSKVAAAQARGEIQH